MKQWNNYSFQVNGFEVETTYNRQTIEKIFFPFLEKVTAMQRAKKERLILFMAAPPAVGKTTLCQFLEYLSKTREDLVDVQALGLDGFHFHSDYIETHDLIRDGNKISMKEVKGCPETFNAAHFSKKVTALKIGNPRWPIYDRRIHDVVEEAQEVTADILLIEGNWLLLQDETWRKIREKADYTIFISAREETLKERLIQRKMKGGLRRKEAEEWYSKSDSVNVRRVLEGSDTGDLNLMMDEDGDYISINDNGKKR